MQTDAFIPYGRHAIDDDDIDAVVRVLQSPTLTQGEAVAQFEDALANYTGARAVSAVSNGTAALQLAYAALDLGAGDQIVTTPITFSATASAAHALGARVAFADVHPATGNIDAASVARAVNSRTRGVVAVHLGGVPADLAELREVCDRHGLWLVEDAAHALGAIYRRTMIGSGKYAEATTFSFHPVKHVATGEGGAVAVRTGALKRRIDRLRHHGIERAPKRLQSQSPGPWYYEVQEAGWNYRLSDLQCALGISQLRKQPAWVQRRRQLAARYRLLITGRLGGLVTPQDSPWDRASAYHLFIVLVDFAAAGTTRARVMSQLRAAGIGTQVHYIPLPKHPHYRRLYGAPPELPGANQYYAQALSLPMYPTLRDSDIDFVVDVLATTLGGTP